MLTKLVRITTEKKRRLILYDKLRMKKTEPAIKKQMVQIFIEHMEVTFDPLHEEVICIGDTGNTM